MTLTDLPNSDIAGIKLDPTEVTITFPGGDAHPIPIGPLGWIEVKSGKLRMRPHWNGPLFVREIAGSRCREILFRVKIALWKLSRE